MDPAHLAKIERHLRPLYHLLPNRLALEAMSRGRRRFHRRLATHLPEPRTVPEGIDRRIWGIHFRSPLMNASGMFKDGEGYELCARWGAGGYIAGTTTSSPREGLTEHGTTHPVAFYPRSGASHNKLSLPNPGHEAVAAALADQERTPGCPIGASLMMDPGADQASGVDGLLRGLVAYTQAGIDWAELNVSCPNTGHKRLDLTGTKQLLNDLRPYLSKDSRLPTVIKFSTDTSPLMVGGLLDLLSHHGVDGVNFGNTSTQYRRFHDQIAPPEQGLYDYFSERHGGGVGGRPLRHHSSRLCQISDRYRHSRHDDRFAIFRTGGIATAEDLRDSPADMHTWFTGLFDAFSKNGHDLYTNVYEELKSYTLAAPTTKNQ